MDLSVYSPLDSDTAVDINVFNLQSSFTGTGLFNFLVEICSFYNIIRLKEESRGGEYLELCQILRMNDRKHVRQERDVYYFNKIGNVYSSMLNLVLNSNELVLRDFDENGDLCQQIEELVKEMHK